MNTYKELTEFYPTPPDLIRKMMDMVEHIDHVDAILEPSAGAGDLAQGALAYWLREFGRYHDKEYLMEKVDCIEKSENLRSVLSGKHLRVIHDDFLTFYPYKKYDLVIMNPPFSDGDKHLLKALEVQKRGGEIVCLLNAETIKNPYTNTRQELKKQLEKYGATIKYATDEFTTPEAQRKTTVEVAIIHVMIPEQITGHFVLDELKKPVAAEEPDRRDEWMVDSDFIKRIVQGYDFEAKAGLTLIDEYESLKPYILNTFDDDRRPSPILELRVDNNDSKSSNVRNRYLRALRLKYWSALFASNEFMAMMTNNLQADLQYNKLQELRNYDFTVYNIRQMQIQVYASLTKGVEETIIELFDLFTRESYWDAHSNNIHYFNGWKTNKAFCVNKKVIVGNMYAFDDWDGDFIPKHQVERQLRDIEKTFDYLDGARTDPINLSRALEQAAAIGQTRKIKTKYFYMTFYKKGTCHLEFRDLELLKKFNLYGCQRKGFLPPSYGKKTYTEMDTEERSVIDEFEGKEEYAKVMNDPDFYICDTGKLLLPQAI